jgi:hypothetical protein
VRNGVRGAGGAEELGKFTYMRLLYVGSLRIVCACEEFLVAENSVVLFASCNHVLMMFIALGDVVLYINFNKPCSDTRRC